jgi:hypothetical protein
MAAAAFVVTVNQAPGNDPECIARDVTRVLERAGYRHVTAQPAPVLGDTAALDRITGLVNANEWNSDLMEPVVTVLRAAGRTIADYPPED